MTHSEHTPHQCSERSIKTQKNQLTIKQFFKAAEQRVCKTSNSNSSMQAFVVNMVEQAHTDSPH